ncbi:unnamed protein product, partial [Linum tenue]
MGPSPLSRARGTQKCKAKMSPPRGIEPAFTLQPDKPYHQQNTDALGDPWAQYSHINEPAPSPTRVKKHHHREDSNPCHH